MNKLKGGQIALMILSVIISIFLPLILTFIKSPWISSTYKEGAPSLYEFFGFSAAIALAANLVYAITLNTKQGKSVIFWLAFGLISYIYLYHFIEFSVPSVDYEKYQKGFLALVSGANPYQGTSYIYPPIFAEAMATITIIVDFGLSFFKSDPAPELVNRVVFYFFQVSQYLLVLINFSLVVEFSKKIGFKESNSIMIGFVLFTVNNPLLRTLIFNQVNLWILTSFLIVLLWGFELHVLAGFFLALGIHIKLYPAILFLPIIAQRKTRRLFLSAVISIVAIFAITLLFPRGLDVWQQFFSFSLVNFTTTESYTAMRINNINGVVYNLLRIFISPDTSHFSLLNTIIGLFIKGLVIIWFSIRAIKRRTNHEKQQLLNSYSLFLLNSIDAISLILFISPVVWEHHYLWVIPIAVTALAVKKGNVTPLFLVSTLLLFAFPTYDIILLSYHRIVGLIGYLICLSPESVIHSMDTHLSFGLRLADGMNPTVEK